MEPNVKNFLVLNGVVLLFVVVYILFGRSQRGTSRLNLSRKNEIIGNQDQGMAMEVKRERTNPSSGGPKDLNVIFQFNGHDFDAHEVLGIPAGCSLAEVEKAYEDAKARLAADEREIVHFAYKAITQR